jgi:hypothetical protein
MAALILVSIACLALAIATFLGGQKLADTRSELAGARTDLAASERTIADLEVARRHLLTEVAAERGISEKRGAVLLRANHVLDGLDPLLASVDALKKDTGDIQAGRIDFQNAADALIQTTIVLVNYLVNTDSSSVDVDYENGLVDQANSQLAAVQSYASQLSRSDTSYSGDASQFDARATTLSNAVSALKKQLRQVAH